MLISTYTTHLISAWHIYIYIVGMCVSGWLCKLLWPWYSTSVSCKHCILFGCSVGLCLLICLSVCASVCLCICLSICASVCLSVHLFVCLYICLPGCASVYLRMCMSDCACVCPDVTKVLVYLAQACHELVPPELVLPCVRAIIDNFITERNSSEVMAVGWVECVVGILQHNLTWVVVVVVGVAVDVIVVFLLFSAMEMELQIQWRHPFV